MQEGKVIAYATRQLKRHECDYLTHGLQPYSWPLVSSGKANMVADALSRKPRLSNSAFQLEKRLGKSKQGQEAKRLLRSDGAIVKQGRLCVPSVRELKDAILEVHSSTYIMHPSNTKMY
ncbi:DNA/RNA polymerases superfamily protein [Cucumis melo var. makuwa]|uniref:DNA/RNA polymerases superfamily protein n=1 Tax=Cucumis melo var. makuwa TaxID=1194695 RepID=A0A5A7UP35_CUCMM|nr:DNA/RNA polymerases superfamily protein [Cucumis melo var. makuwa]TYK16002.1 DNA/RNA polymerases superfamily protein [Cucumis melo var. makuwa]